MTISELNNNEYLDYFRGYILNVPNNEAILTALNNSYKESLSFFESIDEDMMNFRYAEGKWNIKEIINHLIDSERIFNYRALRIARQDKTSLAGFDENSYAKNSLASNRTKKELIEEYRLVRQSSIALFKSFTKEMLLSIGVAGSGNVSVRALGFLISGHELHHIKVIKERYL
jgi:uncharacterized damage-inducible protein DinB